MFSHFAGLSVSFITGRGIVIRTGLFRYGSCAFFLLSLWLSFFRCRRLVASKFEVYKLSTTVCGFSFLFNDEYET